MEGIIAILGWGWVLGKLRSYRKTDEKSSAEDVEMRIRALDSPPQDTDTDTDTEAH
jgi:hypothetical protein